jgi:hypothetical protein
MTVTVVTRRRARPGQEAALIEAVARSAASAAGEGAARGGAARLFQGYEDPEEFFRLVEGESRDAVATAAADGLPDAYCAGTAERQVFERLTGHAGSAALAQAGGGAIVELPPAAGGAALAFSDEVAREMCARPGVVQVAIYRDLDRPHRFLALCDWDSADTRQAFYAEALPRYASAVREHGGRLDVFVERTPADLARYPRAGDQPRPAPAPGLTPTD